MRSCASWEISFTHPDTTYNLHMYTCIILKSRQKYLREKTDMTQKTRISQHILIWSVLWYNSVQFDSDQIEIVLHALRWILGNRMTTVRRGRWNIMLYKVHFLMRIIKLGACNRQVYEESSEIRNNICLVNCSSCNRAFSIMFSGRFRCKLGVYLSLPPNALAWSV